ncbi:MAG: 16S rRNA (guanine(966)-N(2))-methyltransferase RsmD [Clostridia bacterium]|nr:16S rRNA (guanine(966)-N(2))-methyltransferase RsmD [Clostridia bacterium]
MRVISGSARGLKLVSPDGIETRPTLDRVKEAVFSMLSPYINGALILDLFAGSGALGIEALSRGADKSYFIDSSQEAISCINSNITAAKFTKSSVVMKTDAIGFLKNCSQQFDIVFLDPPYADGLYENTINLIAENKLLSNEGLIVIEQDFGAEKHINIGQMFEVFKEKKYGRVGITVLKWR